MMPRKPPPNIVRLSDEFGQYVITIKCICGHARTAHPTTLARFAGWDALLADVIKRMRCSKCNRRGCTATVRHEMKRDG
jgi:hypothetical protein